MGLANLIRIGANEEDREMAFEKIVSSVEDLDQVIRDLNTILNIRRHTSNLVEVDLGEVLARVKRILEKEIEDTHAVISSNFEDAIKVYAVAPYIESVLYNLISNAIKYRDPERIPFITLETINDGDSICLTISDNGLGIDLKKHKHNIFSLYKRFHLHMEGKGLGLYLVKTQILALGGRIEVKSEPNEGTTFFVYLKRYLI
jgi:signal transduction histidine kinase